MTTRGFSKVPQGFRVQGQRLFGDPHRLVAASLRGRSGRQSGQNRSSYSPKPITRGTQTLHKGRSEIVPDKLKPLTRGANQIQSRRSDRQSPRNRPSESPKHPTRGTQTLHKGRRETAQGELKTPTGGANPHHRTCFAQFCVRRKPTAFNEIRPSRRPVPPFRRQNPSHADFSFPPTDFLVQGNRLFGDPYRLFFLRLRGHSDESYGTRFARFPNFCRAAPFRRPFSQT